MQACLLSRPKLMLLQTQRNVRQKKLDTTWHHACLNTIRHTKYSAEALKTSRDKIQFRFHCKELQGGCHETQPYHDPVAGGHVPDAQRHRCLCSVLCESQCAVRLQ